MIHAASHAADSDPDRVRRATSAALNWRIARQTQANIVYYSRMGSADIRERIDELDREWDIERVLEVNASSLALTGLLLGLSVHRKWLVLPMTVMAFLLQHGVQGWCPPLPLLRRLGVRTRGEIDDEKYALKDLLEKPDLGPEARAVTDRAMP